MNLVLFLYIAAFFTLTLGEFGQFPFGKTDFSISVTDILLTMSFSVALIWTIGINKSLIFPRNFIYLMFFWAVCLISLLFSLDLSGWFYFVRFIIYSGTFYITFHLVKSRILGFNEFLKLIKITFVFLASIGIVQLIIFPDLEVLLQPGYDPHKYRVFSTFLDPNFLGAFLIIGFGLIFFELISKKFSSLGAFMKENKWSIISVVILGTAIFFSFSRSAYLMAFIMMVIILGAKNIKLLGAFFITIIFLYLFFPPFNARIQGAINIDKSAAYRFSSWEKGLVIFQDNPILGIGFNNIRNYSMRKNLVQVFSVDGGNSGGGVDSSLIFILATTGLTGFISFALLLFKILSDFLPGATLNLKYFYSLQFQGVKFLKRVFELPVLIRWYKESYKRSKEERNNYLSLPLLALTSGLLINSFFINSLFFPQIMFLWYSLLGVYYGLGEGEGS